MYAFTPVHADSTPEIYVELSRHNVTAFGLPTAPHGDWHLRQFQSREVFNIARKTLGVDTPYAIEKLLTGETFTPDTRSRWWEKLNDGLDLVRALQRNEPASRMWMERLSKYTDEADRMLAMPLWTLSSAPAGASVKAVMSWRRAVEAMGVQIPRFPDRSKISGQQYAKQLSALLKKAETRWAGINVAVFCLRLAQAQGNLAHYALTYEALADDKWFWFEMGLGEPLLRPLLHYYGEWFSTLRLHVQTEADLLELEEDLTAHGLSVNFIRRAQCDDPRYSFMNSLIDDIESTKQESLVVEVSISG